jgi:hypothetical protein
VLFAVPIVSVISFAGKFSHMGARLRIIIFIWICLSTLSASAQNLNINTGGQTGTSGTNWSITGNTLNVAASGTANVHPDVIANHLNNVGDLTVVLPWQSNQFRNCNINATIQYTGNVTRTLIFNIANDIALTSTSLSATNGALNVVFVSATGQAAPDNGRFSSNNSTISTNGGHLWIGGGQPTSTWNGLTIGNSFARTYSPDVSGLYLLNSSLITNGGNLSLRGLAFHSGATAATSNFGVRVEGSSISSGSGDININGDLYGNFVTGVATYIVESANNGASISTTSGNMYISGYGFSEQNQGWRHGIVVQGIVARPTTISSESGNIFLEGFSLFTSHNDQSGVQLQGDATRIVSQTGNIRIKGEVANPNLGQYANAIRFANPDVTNAIRIGFDGTNAYSGNILIEGNSILQRNNNAGAGSIAIQTTGGLTIQSTGDAFTHLRAGDNGTLTFDDDWNFGASMGGFTFGKTTNTSAITFANDIRTVGPITVYANKINMGAAPVVSAGESAQLVTSGANGHISLLAKNGFETLATQNCVRGRVMTTGGGNIHITADADNNNTGVLNIDYLTIDGGTGSILIEGASYNWNTGNNCDQPHFFGTGNFTFRPTNNNAQGFSTQWIGIYQNMASITLGSATNNFSNLDLRPCLGCDVSATNSTTNNILHATNGSIQTHAFTTDVNLNLRTSASGGKIQLRSQRRIEILGGSGSTSLRSLQTNNGDIVLWTNTMNETPGGIIIGDWTTLNSANGSTNQTTGGGKIWIAGGSAINADGLPTGPANGGNTRSGVAIGSLSTGLTTTSLYSGGGEIFINGESNAVSPDGLGVTWTRTGICNSGNGSITIKGEAKNASGAHGIELGAYGGSIDVLAGGGSSSIPAISLEGKTARNDFSGLQTGGNRMQATGAGGISIVTIANNSGTGPSNNLGTALLTASGDIFISAQGGTGLRYGGTLGKLASSDVTSSSSNITLRANQITVNNGINVDATGQLVVEPFGTSFTNALSWPIANFSVADVTGLRLGKEGNTANITTTAAQTIAGPIEVYGGNININENFNTTAGGTNGAVLLKGTGNIIQAASKTITTAGGDVTLWADSDASNGGYILTGGGSNSGITTGGGNITLGGGTNLTTGYAKATAVVDATGRYVSGVHLRDGTTINSGGGNIVMRGQNVGDNVAIVQAGIMGIGTTLDAGSGKISLTGLATGSGSANAQGVSRDGTNWIIRSSNSDADAIQIIGDATGTNNSLTSLGLNFAGIIESTGGGGIILNGRAGTSTGYDQGLDIRGDVLANSGTITLIGQNDVATQTALFLANNSSIGSKTGTNVTSSGSDIVLKSDNTVFNTTTNINTSGTVSIVPLDASSSFGVAQTLGSNTVLSSNVSGLTIGKPSNTADVTIAAAQTIAGPIEVYGGNININENLNTTAGGTNGAVLLKGTGNIIQAASKTITAAGGDVTLWADSDGNGSGYIQTTGGANSGITTGGGNITLGGGTDIATGYARGAALADPGLFVNGVNTVYISGVHLRDGTNINSGGGNITMRGRNVGDNQSRIQFGIMGHNTTVDAGNGKITLTGLAGGSGGFGAANAQGISNWGNGWMIRSSNPSGNAISLGGDASLCDNANTSLGINFSGTIEATGGGGIHLYGKSSTAAVYDQPLDIYGNILASSGTITLEAENDVATQTGLFLSGATIGSKSGTNITSSTSNIILKSDNTIFNSATNINTSGAVSIVPLDASNSFGVAQTLGSNTVLSSNVSGLTIGKSSNTANISINTPQAISGSVELYGGTLNINESIASTAGGIMSLYGNSLNVASSKAISSLGKLIIAPQNPALNIGMAGAAGDLNLPESYFSTNFTQGFSNIQIGSENQIGDISINAFSLSGNMGFLTSGDLIVGGNVSMGNNDVALSSAIANIHLGTPEHYFLTNGTGKLFREIPEGMEMLFPVGNAYYNPAVLTNRTGVTDALGVRVMDAMYVEGLSGDSVTGPHVQVTWDIDKGLANTGAGIDFQLSWDVEQEQGVIPAYTLLHHDGMMWNLAEGSSELNEENGIKTLVHTGYTGTFSPFAIGDINTVLPVTLTSFEANCKGENVVLTWTTAAEFNNDFFMVYGSTDAINWTALERIAGNGTSNVAQRYQTEVAGSAYPYFRLLQQDYDGTKEWLPIVRVDCDQARKISANPNPFDSRIIFSGLDANASYSLKVYRENGQLLANYDQVHSEEISTIQWQTGIYLLVLQSDRGEVCYFKLFRK